MKIRLALIFCLLSFVLFAQRSDVPQKNPNNSLDLKVVFQEYTITTTYAHGGRTTTKGEYLNLKVNDLYLENGQTGINKPTFQKYLSSCPKSLDLGLQGLDQYRQSNKFYKIGNLFQWGGFGTGLYYGLKDINDVEGKSLIKFALPVLTGFIGRVLISNAGKKRGKKADGLVVNAFDYYSDNCFKPDLNNPSAYVPYVEEVTENGESNDKEKVIIDILTNNAKSKFLTLGGVLGLNGFSSVNFKIGPDISYFKEGFYLNGHAFISRYALFNEPEDIDPQFGGHILGSIPFVKKVKRPKKGLLYIGSMQGLAATVKSENLEGYYLAAVSLDLGMDYFQQYTNNFGSFSEYFQKTTMLRAGISRTLFSEASFKVNDNRFSKSTRYQIGFLRLYLNALYNLNTDFNTDIVNSNFNQPREINNDLGFAIGLEGRGSMNRKKSGVSFNIELARYPFGWGGKFGLGYNFYSADRKKMKIKRGRNSQSKSRSSRKRN